MDKGTKKYISDEVEKLAMMVKGGFDEVIQKMDKGFTEVHERLDKADGRLMRIELGYGTRLERAEDNIRLIKTKIGMR